MDDFLQQLIPRIKHNVRSYWSLHFPSQNASKFFSWMIVSHRELKKNDFINFCGGKMVKIPLFEFSFKLLINNDLDKDDFKLDTWSEFYNIYRWRLEYALLCVYLISFFHLKIRPDLVRQMRYEVVRYRDFACLFLS